jgi:hypothetical protein
MYEILEHFDWYALHRYGHDAGLTAGERHPLLPTVGDRLFEVQGSKRHISSCFRLLPGNIVLYAVEGPDASYLAYGGTHVP